MSAFGRKQTFKSAVFERAERPLSGKADIRLGASGIGSRNDRFTPETGHWAKLGQKVR